MTLSTDGRPTPDGQPTPDGRHRPDGRPTRGPSATDGVGTPGDPFGTAAVRRHVLAAWSASPARFREDANAEEDAALGAYRDRLAVELLQNAADAARLAGVGARVRLHLSPDRGVLEVSNTGAPLATAGVEALSTLRASAKRDTAAVGRFGVGFTAVLAVTDAPAVFSPRTGGVRWSADGTRSAAATIDSLADELHRRDGAVPVLRLPFPADDEAPPPAGYDTVVRLPLRDAAALDLARRLLNDLDPTLPLTLPGIEEIVVEPGDGTTRVLRCDWEQRGDTEVAVLAGRRWVGRVRRGTIPTELLADRPVEERGRTSYEARAMVPAPGEDWPAGAPLVLRAPQPTDEPLSVPALVSVNLPLEPSRRRSAPGPLRDWLLERTAEAVVELATLLGGDDPRETPAPAAAKAAADDPATGWWVVADQPSSAPTGDGAAAPARAGAGPLVALSLVPVGLPAGEADGRLRDEITRLIADAAMLPGGRRGRDCRVLDLGPAAGPVTAVLADVDGLLPPEFGARSWTASLAALGVRRLSTADVVELVTGLERPAAWWASLYTAIAPAPDRDALGALPVPLAEPTGSGDGDDGPTGGGVRRVTGPRGLLLPTAELDVEALLRSGLDLRVVHPDACVGSARELLRTLGAVEGTPRGILGDPAVEEAVTSPDPVADLPPGPDAEQHLATAVLALVRDARLSPDEAAREFPWLSELLLPDADGELVPAGELLRPDGPLAGIVTPDAPFGVLAGAVADAWPNEVLEAVGVVSTFTVLRAPDVRIDLDDPVLLELDASDRWVDEVADGDDSGDPFPPTVAEFAAIRDLELVADDAWPLALRELARPGRLEVVLAPEPNYTRWWLSRFARLPVDDPDRADDPGRAAGPVATRPPGELVLAGADPPLTGLYDPVVALPGVPLALLRALGGKLRIAEILTDPEATLDLLDRLGDAERDVDWGHARALYAAAAAALSDLGARDENGDGGFAPPLTVRTPDGVVAAPDAVVVDAPDLLPLLGGRAGLRVALPAASTVAEVLDLPLASGLVGAADGGGHPEPDPAAIARTAPDGTPYVEHEQLVVRDVDGRPVPVGWRVVGGVGGNIHVATAAGPDALGRALAWRAGTWSRRHAWAARLRDPGGAAARAAEDDLDHH